ncbi:MAG: hypothetical protein ABIP38_08100 [Steroidobacteraceae bacterium]
MRNPVLTLLTLSLLCTAAQGAENLCDRSGSRTTPSPDGRWAAHVQEEVCATSTGAAAGITVVIESTSDPAISRRVFIMPVPRSRDDWPRIRWDAPDAMEVRVPNMSEATPPEPLFEGIRISLAYCGDNPSDRARLAAYKAAVLQWQKDVTAWVQQRKQDPERAGARPPRPEEPVIPPGRCLN